MLKGINKRVIVIKNLNSEIIEEAHFILKNTKGMFKNPKENEMVVEANRIISEYHSQQKQLADKGSYAHETTTTELEKYLSPKQDEKDKEKGRGEGETNCAEMSPSVSELANLSDEELFEDSKLFEHLQGTPLPKDYFHIGLNESHSNYFKPSFNIASAQRIKKTRFRLPPKSFFIGIGVMSAIVIAIKLIEYIVMKA